MVERESWPAGAHSAPMERAPALLPGSGKFDAFRLARERAQVEGDVDAVTLPRIADRLVEDQAPLHWRIRGTSDPLGRPALALDVEGMLPLECQRCLGVYHWPVDQHIEVLLARDAAEVARLDNDSDLEVVLASAPVDPLELVEDELVLSAPFAPRHPDAECTAPD